MSEEQIRFLGDVQRLVLRPGDSVVITLPGRLSEVQRKTVYERAAEAFQGHKVIVIEEGMSLGVLGDE